MAPWSAPFASSTGCADWVLILNVGTASTGAPTEFLHLLGSVCVFSGLLGWRIQIRRVMHDTPFLWVVNRNSDCVAKCGGGCCAECRSAKKGKTGSHRRRPGHPLRNENHSRLQAVVMTEALKLPYSVQGRGTVESIGNHFYRVCGPAGCTVVMGLSNALYLSRNVPESASPADP